MFTLATTPTFSHPVKVQVPVDGGHEEQTFRARFRVLPADGTGEEHDLNTAEGSTAFLKAIVVDMDEIADAEGKSVPYNDRVRDQLFKLPFVRVGLVRTYFAAIGKATEGN